MLFIEITKMGLTNKQGAVMKYSILPTESTFQAYTNIVSCSGKITHHLFEMSKQLYRFTYSRHTVCVALLPI